MAEEGPRNKAEIQEIFRRLRQLPANRMCFDCQAKNPTWASVTYGVFICIDCSAVHRSLGVHLSFVRSTQLDTNWTWTQLQHMKVGGNANALTSFSQHHCTTTDAQQKYNSRAAHLYREKLSQAVAKYRKIHGDHLDFDSDDHSRPEVEKDSDFFEEIHSKTPTTNQEPLISSARLSEPHSNNNGSAKDLKGPNVDNLAGSFGSGPRKTVIGQRKPASKLGAKKGGLGAQKVKANFAEIEKEAEMLDQMKERRQEEARLTMEQKAADEERKIATMSLAYQDISQQQKKKVEQLKTVDPKKADQVERLGMGIGFRSGVSHSMMSDMQVIDQDTPAASSSSSSTYMNKMSSSPRGKLDSFFDEYELVDSLGAVSMSSSSGFSSKKSSDWDFDRPRKVEEEEPIVTRPKYREPISSSASTDEAQKKFGNAKAISSDQFFSGAKDNDYERNANLARFEGQSSISSADYFGDGQQQRQTHSSLQSFQNVDIDDVKESVRQGVTKVAGKLSTMANGMMSSLQEKYGY